MSSWADMELSSRYGGAMGDDEENQRKSDERERKKAEVRRRLEDANRSKKAKKGFLTPERKKKLRKLLMMKAAEDLKQQQMLKEQERQRILQERILPLPDLNSCDVDETFEEFLERVLELESDIYDLSYTVRQKGFRNQRAHHCCQRSARKIRQTHAQEGLQDRLQVQQDQEDRVPEEVVMVSNRELRKICDGIFCGFVLGIFLIFIPTWLIAIWLSPPPEDLIEKSNRTAFLWNGQWYTFPEAAHTNGSVNVKMLLSNEMCADSPISKIFGYVLIAVFMIGTPIVCWIWGKEPVPTVTNFYNEENYTDPTPWNNTIKFLDQPPKLYEHLHILGNVTENATEFCVILAPEADFGKNAPCQVCAYFKGNDSKIIYTAKKDGKVQYTYEAPNPFMNGTEMDLRIRFVDKYVQIFAQRGEIGIFEKLPEVHEAKFLIVSGNVTPLAGSESGSMGGVDRREVSAEPVSWMDTHKAKEQRRRSRRYGKPQYGVYWFSPPVGGYYTIPHSPNKNANNTHVYTPASYSYRWNGSTHYSPSEGHGLKYDPSFVVDKGTLPKPKRIDILFYVAKEAEMTPAWVVSFRFTERSVVLNTYDGHWKDEDRADFMPIDDWRLVDLVIWKYSSKMHIFINNYEFATYDMNTPLYKSNTMRITGDLEILGVKMNALAGLLIASYFLKEKPETLETLINGTDTQDTSGRLGTLTSDTKLYDTRRFPEQASNTSYGHGSMGHYWYSPRHGGYYHSQPSPWGGPAYVPASYSYRNSRNGSMVYADSEGHGRYYDPNYVIDIEKIPKPRLINVILYRSNGHNATNREEWSPTFKLSFRFDLNTTTLSRFDGGWVDEEKADFLPIDDWRLFDLAIRPANHKLYIYINNYEFASYKLSSEIMASDYIGIEGDVEILGLKEDGLLA
ncbi:unnamed protein product, partial [Mesorhabditis spiculigera]